MTLLYLLVTKNPYFLANSHIKIRPALSALIELRYDGNLITPGMTLETIRKAALKN